jgi:tetratricopeptide (TPR) repeat protein
MQCLDRRVSELRALAGVLATADRDVVARADHALDGLGRVEDCADVARLRDRVPLPDDPRRRAEIADVEAELDHLQALDLAGRWSEQLGRAPAAVMRAMATGYLPVYARALMRWASLLADHEDDAQSIAAYRLAVTAADAAHEDVGRGRALDGLARVIGDHQEHFDEGAEYARQALAVADRTGDYDLQTEVEIQLAHLASATSHLADAVAHDERAVAIQRAHPGSRRVHAEFDLGSELVEVRRFDEGERVLRGVLAELRATYGTDLHPDVAGTLANLAAAEFESARGDDAIRDLRHVIEIDAQLYEPESREVLTQRMNLATMIDGAGRHADAEAELRAILPIAERTLGPSHSLTVSIAHDLGDILDHEDEVAASLDAYRDAYARAAKVDPTSIDAINARSAIAGALVRLKRDREAVPELEAVLALQSKQTGPDGYDALFTRADLGRAYYDTGDAARAIPELERAIKDLDAMPDVDAPARGMFRTDLAKALWVTGARDRARALAGEAHAILDAAGDEGKDQRDDLAAWETSVGLARRASPH